MTSQLEIKLRTYPSNYLTYSDLCALLPISDNARYAQIKRLLKKQYLLRLHQGFYYKGDYLQKEKPHLFEMAYHICWPSYISLTSALSYHGLIPEAVYEITSVIIKRSCKIDNDFGHFSYHKLPKDRFFCSVTREEEANSVFLVASPWKALTDYVYCYKKNWVNMSPVEESLRIELETLPFLTIDEAKKLADFYQQNRIHKFLEGVIRYYHEHPNHSATLGHLSKSIKT